MQQASFYASVYVRRFEVIKRTETPHTPLPEKSTEGNGAAARRTKSLNRESG